MRVDTSLLNLCEEKKFLGLSFPSTFFFTCDKTFSSLMRRWKLDYTSLCVNTTFCPESFKEFVKQRRRWIMSEVGNMIAVFRNGWRLCRRNDTISFGYIVLLFVLFISGKAEDLVHQRWGFVFFRISIGGSVRPSLDPFKNARLAHRIASIGLVS